VPVPTWSNGQVLAASDVNSYFVPLAAYKTADLARTSSSQVADPDLSVAVAANAVYLADICLFYKGASSGNNLQFTWTIPAGTAGGLYAATYVGGGFGVVIEANSWTDAAHTAGAQTGGTVYGVDITGTVSTGGTAGNFTLNWGASGGTVTLSARSRLVFQRIG
jgi:hypothetical protein